MNDEKDTNLKIYTMPRPQTRIYASGPKKYAIITSRFITCSAVIRYADWSIVVIPGTVHTLWIQYRTAKFNSTT